MNNLQHELFRMFCWFHEFCEENNLRYYMLGGTMLGAVRHQGFIPWDDDIDVGMPRKDYEKLEKIMSERVCERYVLETPQTKAKEYLYSYSKLYDTQTTLIEIKKYQIVRGIFLDVFPLDGIGNSEEQSKENYKKVLLKRRIFASQAMQVCFSKDIGKSAVALLSRMIPKCILNEKKALFSLIKTCRKYEYDEMLWCGNLVGLWKDREIMPRSVLGNPKLYSFEGKQFYGPEQADRYLTNLYGDWRKIPPEEKRVSHHDFAYVSLEEPFRAR